MSNPLPPAEFNPTVFDVPLPGDRHEITVTCFGKEVGKWALLDELA